MSSHIPYFDASVEEAGLRERKRIETLCSIEDHATQLVLDNGYENVTVDDICHAAHISKRTFFNYFDSKRTATLGRLHTDISDELQGEFFATSANELIKGIIRLILQQAQLNEGRSEEFMATLQRRRKKIMHASEELAAARVMSMMRQLDLVSLLVGQYFDRHPEARRLPTVDAEQESRMLVTMAHSAIRMGTHYWMNGTSSSHAELYNACVGALGTMAYVLDQEYCPVHSPKEAPADNQRAVSDSGPQAHNEGKES